jgi:hypothetical protein
MHETEAKNRIEVLSKTLECGMDLAADIMDICAVVKPEQLYAKYVAVGKTDLLFAAALHLAPEEWAGMMAKLRAALPEDLVKMLETPVDIKKMPVTGYRPPKERIQAETGQPGDEDQAESGKDDVSKEEQDL